MEEVNKDTKILLDLQEKKRFASLLEHIKKSGNVQFVQLKTGDILISGERGIILIERKSIGDFAGSLASGQLFKELKQMSEETKVIIEKMETDLVEVVASLVHERWMFWTQNIIFDLDNPIDRERNEKWKVDWKPYSKLAEEIKEKNRIYAREIIEKITETPFFHTFVLVEGSILEIIRRDWKLDSLLSGLAMLPLSWKVNLIWLENKDLTPLLIESFANYVGKAREPPRIYGTRPKRKSRSISEQQQFLIEGFAGIGGETANKILAETGSPFALFEKLRLNVKVPGLGPKREEIMRHVIFDEYIPKRKKKEKGGMKKC